MARPSKESRRGSKERQLETYKRIRKPMPPPERVMPDERRKELDRRAEREAREELP